MTGRENTDGVSKSGDDPGFIEGDPTMYVVGSDREHGEQHLPVLHNVSKRLETQLNKSDVRIERNEACYQLTSA